MDNHIEIDTISLSKTFLIITYVASFTIPFLIGGPQILVGILVNIALIYAAITYKDIKTLFPLFFLPSIGVLTRGYIFGPFTPLLFYMVPFIWASNATLILVIKNLYVEKKFNYFFTLLVASLIKTFVLYLSAYGYFSFKILPAIFLKTMGFNQFLTATIAGIIVYMIIKTKNLNLIKK